VNEVTTTTATTSSTTTTTTTTPTATEPVCFIDIDVVDRDTNVSDASTLDCVQPVLSEEILTQIKQYCDEVGSIALIGWCVRLNKFGKSLQCRGRTS